MLAENGKTLSAAESCTGGTISALLTSVPGSSTYYLGSVTSYANEIKMNVLGVPEEIIAKYGAVSSECVAAMAEGVRKLTGSDYSVATSGIAGPGGGSEEKPVGLVWIGVSSEKGTETFKMVFRNDRKRNIERFASSALNKLREKLVNELKY
jgi:nicotinamide-nucleotide amidase